MSGVKKFDFYVGTDGNRAVIGNSDGLIGGGCYVRFGEQRLPVEFFAARLRFFPQKFRVARLNMRAVHHNEVGKAPCGRGGVNIAFVPFFDKIRQKSAVVVVRVRQYDRLDFFGRNFQIPVFFVGNGAFALESPAVNQVRPSVDFQNVFGTGDLFNSSQRVKCNAHDVLLLNFNASKRGKQVFFGGAEILRKSAGDFFGFIGFFPGKPRFSEVSVKRRLFVNRPP